MRGDNTPLNTKKGGRHHTNQKSNNRVKNPKKKGWAN